VFRLAAAAPRWWRMFSPVGAIQRAPDAEADVAQD